MPTEENSVVPSLAQTDSDIQDTSDYEPSGSSENITEKTEGLEIPKSTRKVVSLILKRLAYTLSYNKSTLCPNWVAWVLTKDHTDGPYNRKDFRFHEDMDVPFPRAYYEDYKGSPLGMQRGHMCPAADNKWSDKAMDECHLMTNICPQYGELNGGDWKDLEDACREWAETYNCIYIVCGPIFSSNHCRKIGEHNISVPDAFFKVILRLGKHPQALGFIYPNKKCSGRMTDYALSVDDVEKAVGLDFFSTLDDNIENKVERSSNLNAWN